MSRTPKWQLLIAVAVASSLHAQALREQVTVNVVEVPVNVTRNGKAVAGLSADDFELYVNGARHPIQYFDVIEAPSAEESRPLDRRRLVVLLFDTKTTSHRGIERAKEAARIFVEESSPAETFAVARLTRDGTRWIVPFTSDRETVLRAIATLTPSRAGDAFNLAMLPAERLAVTSGGSVGEPEPSSTTAADLANPAHTNASAFAEAALAHEEKIYEQQRRDEQSRVTDQLGVLADRLAPISGVKRVIFLSEGDTGGADRTRAKRMHERFQAAGVVLDAVELDALHVRDYRQTTGQVSRSRTRMATPEGDKTISLYTLALETGGTVTKHGNIVAALREIRDLQRVTYVLGFTPPPDQKNHNSIFVNVRGQPFGTTVNHRRGYSSTLQGDRGDALFLADVLLNDIAQRGLTLDVDVQKDGGSATVVASIPGSELLARGDEKEALLDVFFYVFDKNASPEAWAYSQLRIDLTKAREFLESNPYTIRKAFNLGSGTYAAKVLVRIAGSDVAGFQRSDFQMR